MFTATGRGGGGRGGGAAPTQPRRVARQRPAKGKQTQKRKRATHGRGARGGTETGAKKDEGTTALTRWCKRPGRLRGRGGRWPEQPRQGDPRRVYTDFPFHIYNLYWRNSGAGCGVASVLGCRLNAIARPPAAEEPAACSPVRPGPPRRSKGLGGLLEDEASMGQRLHDVGDVLTVIDPAVGPPYVLEVESFVHV